MLHRRFLLAVFSLVFITYTFDCYAQTKAITDTGKEVYLYDNGTWKYVENNENERPEIGVNPKAFIKGDAQSFRVTSKRVNVGLWMDPSEWEFSSAIDNPEAEYEFKLKDEDLFALMITERMELPIDFLRTAALENVRSMSPDVTIVNEEFRFVNDNKVLMMHMNVNMQGARFSYLGYYFSNSSGSVQLITFTSQNLMEEYREHAEQFLSGLDVLE